MKIADLQAQSESCKSAIFQHINVEKGIALKWLSNKCDRHGYSQIINLLNYSNLLID